MLIKPSREDIDSLVRMALREDAPWGDLTSQTLIPHEATVTAKLVAREAGVLCGEDIFKAGMLFYGDVACEFDIHDGQSFVAGDTLATVNGSAVSVLQSERVSLNFIQRLSGIATLTSRYVAEIAGFKARIVDTRKTTPGLRVMERYAVRCGGGRNHRFSLSDAVMAKDNHLALLLGEVSPTGFSERLRSRLSLLPHTTHVEVEVDRLDQIEPVLAADIDTIMLDNFSIADLRAGVEQVHGRALVEASGGVTLERVREIASAGVDVISVGALTQNAKSIDLGLDIDL